MTRIEDMTTRTATRRAVMQKGAVVLGAGALSFAFGRATYAQGATPTTAGSGSDLSSLGLPELKITVGSSGFEGVPSSVVAGRYLVTLINTSKTGGSDSAVAGFLQLPDGVTVADLSQGPPRGSPPAEMASPVAAAAASPAADTGGQGGPPPWFYTTKLAGGPSATAGQTVRGIVDLTPGNWVVWGEDPASPNQPVALTVTGVAGATPTAGAAPSAAVTVHEVSTADGFAFQVEGSFQPGMQLVEIRNESDQPHFLLMLSSPIPLTMEQVQALLQLPDGATPEPSSGLPDPSTFKTAVYAGTQSPGTTQWIEADLPAGSYVMLCFVGDPTKGGEPHAAEGMAKIITVGDAGTPAA